MIYKVDVKAYLFVTVEAESAEEAVREATDFVEGLSPDKNYVKGWADARPDGPRVLEARNCFDTEDTDYVTDEEGNELDV